MSNKDVANPFPELSCEEMYALLYDEETGWPVGTYLPWLEDCDDSEGLTEN